MLTPERPLLQQAGIATLSHTPVKNTEERHIIDDTHTLLITSRHYGDEMAGDTWYG